ncbi:N,N-dimethylformamidase beta subunit family domain-containing protein [Catenulispora yoronensis]
MLAVAAGVMPTAAAAGRPAGDGARLTAPAAATHSSPSKPSGTATGARTTTAKTAGAPGSGPTTAASSTPAAPPVTTPTQLPPPAPQSTPNAIFLENQNPGSGAWQIPQPGKRVGDDAHLQLEAYADANSVQHGQTIGFHVTTTPAQNYSVQIFRMGYYGGAGARLMTTSEQIPGGPQPTCPLDVPTGLIECHWATGWQLAVPNDWLSGLYLAVFTNASGYQWADPFTVTEPTRPSQIVLVDPVNNYEAYNEWPYNQVYGKNLYVGFGPMTVAGTGQAVKVSFDRPYQQEYGAGERDRGSNWTARWLEQNGYDVTYATSTDMQQNTIDLGNYKVYISPNHDEYWSGQMYDKLQAAEQKGLSLAFLSANSIYWQVRSEPSSSGQADRVVVCYKGINDPVQGPTTTRLWRDLGRPEQALLGASYEWAMAADTSWISSGAGGPAQAGAQVGKGAVIPKLIGVEADRVVPGQANPQAKQFYVLSNSPFSNRYAPNTAPQYLQQSTLYQAMSDAWVFDAGTFNWGKGLADTGRGYADGRVATMMADILATMLGQSNAATVDRVAAADRYGTAAAISRYAFPSGASSVYIANGTAFADALTGAPAAGHDKAPTLLTDTGALPAATAAELNRLAPQTIYVLGGPAVVSDAVVAQLARYAHGGGVRRLAGADRYGTAVAVSQHAFAPGVPVAYVAAGTGYPDAMAAGAAGAHEGAPVLLTDSNALTASTAAELQRLHPTKIVVLGGLKAVSGTVQAQLWNYAPVTRAAGADRYQTAAALASMTQHQGTVDTVFLANGLTLADGLTGGAAAGLVGAPLLTTDSGGLNPGPRPRSRS